jgi:hypothetical protein
MELTEQQYVAALRRWFGLSEALRSDASREAEQTALRAAFEAWSMRPSLNAYIGPLHIAVPSVP